MNADGHADLHVGRRGAAAGQAQASQNSAAVQCVNNPSVKQARRWGMDNHDSTPEVTMLS
jgi:hypothetical protein